MYFRYTALRIIAVTETICGCTIMPDANYPAEVVIQILYRAAIDKGYALHHFADCILVL